MAGISPEQFQRLQALFDEAAELPAGEQGAFVERACAGDSELRERLLKLLKHAQSGELMKPVTEGAAVGALDFEGRLIPSRLGPYELLEQIGRGGMGAVYRAQRVDAEYRSTVAIKLVRPGMDSDFVLSRFRRERQTLAKLSHPNIARLLDGGTTENGVPYIVMEYITGAVLTEYAHARRWSTRTATLSFIATSSRATFWWTTAARRSCWTSASANCSSPTSQIPARPET